MLSRLRPSFIVIVMCFGAVLSSAQQQGVPAPSQSPKPPAVDQWGDDFDGSDLDQSKWERFTFEGGSGGLFKVEEGELRMRGVFGSRSGVRSKPSFTGDHWVINATLSKVGSALPESGQTGTPLGNAILTVLFDGSGRNRIEWILTSEGMFEAWAMVDGRGERLDSRTLATKAAKPTLSIARRGDDYFFALNGQVGLEKKIKSLPDTFHVMLYGYGSSENNWDSVQVLVPKKH
jgi:hypothetical protein